MINKLNPKQLEAVKYTSGPLLVIAGAGSGKTRIITNKIAFLISEYGFAAKNIVAITFTNKAAKEMQERTAKLLQEINTKGLTISTFHSLGLRILKEEAAHLGYKTNFSILDSHDSNKIISDILKTTDKAFILSIKNQISLWKNSLTTPEQLLNQTKDEQELQHARIFLQYQDTLKTYQAVDFDDLIKLPLDLFMNNLEILYKWQQKIGYLLVDEYQDTNECQYKLIKTLCARSNMLTAVGDDDQSIYSWRGANPNNLLKLQDDFKQLKIIKLEQNYRSTNTILNAANSVIQNNNKIFNKKLWSEFGQGEPVRVIACQNEETEAETIIRNIMLHQIKSQGDFANYAILYRSNHQARIFEQSLRNYQLPYTISGGQSFFDKAEIKDIIAYLRLLTNDDDDTAFIRAIITPRRGIGQVTLDKLVNYAKTRKISLFTALFEEGFQTNCNVTQLNELTTFAKFINDFQYRMNRENVAEFLLELTKQIGYETYLYEQEANSKVAEKKWTNVLSLITWLDKKATEKDKKLSDLVQTIILISILDNSENKEISAIQLSTLHAAKGLEYPYVYLISCEEGILPHQESINLDQIEEERRLMYVGITRAKQELTISYCEKRRQGGETRTVERSRFLAEMGKENLRDESTLRFQKISNNTEIQDRLNQLKQLLK